MVICGCCSHLAGLKKGMATSFLINYYLLCQFFFLSIHFSLVLIIFGAGTCPSSQMAKCGVCPGQAPVHHRTNLQKPPGMEVSSSS